MGEEAVALLVFGIVLERVVIVSSSLAWSAWHDRVFFLLHTSGSLYHYCYSYYYVSVQLSQFPSFSPSKRRHLGLAAKLLLLVPLCAALLLASQGEPNGS